MRTITNLAILMETLGEALPGARVVDVGCGEGRLSRKLVEAGAASAVGIECSPRQLAKANALPPMDGVRIVDGVGQALPLPDDSADIVIFFNSLHHIPAAVMGKALAEAARVLGPGGMVYACEPVAEGDFYELCRAVDDEAEVRAQAFAALHGAAADGLVVEREEVILHPVRIPDYATFRERLISSNSEREAIFARLDAKLRQDWDRLGGRDEDGTHTFSQPSRITVLRRS